jgi:hypothetical protein
MRPISDKEVVNGKWKKRSTNVPMYCMEVGDSFRLLSKYGKPTGPRHTVIAEFETHTDTITTDKRIVSFNTLDQFTTKVKPINFVQLIVEARMTWDREEEFPWKQAL